MWGVKGLCGVVVDIRTGVSVILTAFACGGVDLGLCIHQLQWVQQQTGSMWVYTIFCVMIYYRCFKLSIVR